LTVILRALHQLKRTSALSYNFLDQEEEELFWQIKIPDAKDSTLDHVLNYNWQDISSLYSRIG
jgi:hypothetical protein